jgi:hypothetical protein
VTGYRRWTALALLASLVGCTPEPPAIGTGTVELGDVAPGVVTRADVVSVLTVDAVVVATPAFDLATALRD